MIFININGIALNVKPNSTVLQACNNLNINIPKFCFQENLEIAGNCRMCLVEIKNSPKPVASCATPVIEGMHVFTDTPLVKKARESVLEFLLINHPLDCPICDQGGECDLQDQTLYFGTDRSRYFELKRAVEDKNCGPFIKTIMTRCIHCTRCVRFANEICGIDNLGTTGRGNKTEISFYLNNIFKSEFSGNVIDLCPVGALTSKPFAFKARSWEIKKKQTIDILDGIGSNIIVQTFNNNIIRILPKVNKDINIEWITNKTRFFFDSIKYQRINEPLIKTNDSFKPITWERVFNIIKQKTTQFDPSNQNAVIGNLIDLKSLFTFKQFLNNIGINKFEYKTEFNYNNNTIISSDIMCESTFKLKLKDLSKCDLCLLVFCDPRKEGSILNLHLRNTFKKHNLEIFSIGSKLDLTYPVKNLGLNILNLIKILEGKHSFCQKILSSKNFIIIVGSNIYNIPNGINILKSLYNKFQNKINILQLESGFLNFLEIFHKKKNYKESNKLTFLYNTDNISILSNDNYKIYIGHHFTQDAQNSNLILPSTTFLEKNSYFLSTDGIIKKSIKTLNKNNNIKNDYNLFQNLNYFINESQDYIIFDKLVQQKKVNNEIFYKNNIESIFIDSKIIKPLVNIPYKTNILEKHSKILMNSLKNENTLNNFII